MSQSGRCQRLREGRLLQVVIGPCRNAMRKQLGGVRRDSSKPAPSAGERYQLLVFPGWGRMARAINPSPPTNSTSITIVSKRLAG
jgi:hypothetical protein